MTPSAHKKENQRFSVLTLNLRFGLAEDGPNSWRFRQKAFPEFFDRYRSDFLCLQEANDFQIDYFSQILPEYDYIGKRHPAPAFWQNNVIFYKNDWKCNERQHFYLSSTPTIPSRSAKSRWPRQCTLGLFAKGNFRLICVNTHFDFDVSVRIESARLILQRIFCFPDDIPAVLLGDFNASPADPCYRILTGKEQGSPADRPYFSNVFKKPYPGTFHGFSGKNQGEHIDWILYRPGIVQESCTVVRDTFKGIYLSDHFPLSAVFRWV